ncbi:Transcriptional regulator, LysR family [Pseudomonas chlororaphis subsp. piscium]|uniref:LysR substrate-binding domain-containing protein n=1 Tax=Pseudomonas chlororaphis TaxID=587753 RepID=UPI0006A59136|nr:LysR substrate-binding domain-containing protein [Pseudomonas chlororaphis]AZC32209.1 Transcriptional regulator, LysR family [Pseudomonas chlororaphis subsp. piscium]WDG89938.1 LysR substrate-binding domain-containing protein [Pseudomonas chlororaphis]SDS70857.1 transcriptional regulator, LysR family [Pseudomonas chlororaphis]
MLDLNDIYLYVQVVEHQGITAAARVLGVPKSSISRRILALEASLGTRLIQRTSRRFVVTEIGVEFHRHALAMLVEAEAAENVVRRRASEPSGTIRFTCSISYAQLVLAKLIPGFMAAYPRVSIVQHATNRCVDTVQEGFDLCLRAHIEPLPDSSLIQRSIARTPWYLFASPAYVDRKGMPSEPDELSTHDGIALGSAQESYAWHLREEHSGIPFVVQPFTPNLVSDDMTTLKAAACAGLGIVALPGFVGAAEVEQGQLIRVLPHWIAGLSTLSVLMPSRRGLLPSVSAFVGYLAEHVPMAVQ